MCGKRSEALAALRLKQIEEPLFIGRQSIQCKPRQFVENVRRAGQVRLYIPCFSFPLCHELGEAFSNRFFVGANLQTNKKPRSAIGIAWRSEKCSQLNLQPRNTELLAAEQLAGLIVHPHTSARPSLLSLGSASSPCPADELPAMFRYTVVSA